MSSTGDPTSEIDVEFVVSQAMLGAVLDHRRALLDHGDKHSADYWVPPDANHRHLMALAVLAALTDAGYVLMHKEATRRGCCDDWVCCVHMLTAEEKARA